MVPVVRSRVCYEGTVTYYVFLKVSDCPRWKNPSPRANSSCEIDLQDKQDNFPLSRRRDSPANSTLPLEGGGWDVCGCGHPARPGSPERARPSKRRCPPVDRLLLNCPHGERISARLHVLVIDRNVPKTCPTETRPTRRHHSHVRTRHKWTHRSTSLARPLNHTRSLPARPEKFTETTGKMAPQIQVENVQHQQVNEPPRRHFSKFPRLVSCSFAPPDSERGKFLSVKELFCDGMPPTSTYKKERLCLYI
ncbi:uncharacterized protein LOC118428732 [Branchiostoma floridae]|uniref:Uncharacterized protein LOC118428732 n=1 Tax=Branchiostoma floridae TaxID=7739 RepID=A0A9J7M7A2_BRAFL|nr:uncharacterized protein LOC118428732 [Branchiostoma floridae]